MMAGCSMSSLNSKGSIATNWLMYSIQQVPMGMHFPTKQPNTYPAYATGRPTCASRQICYHSDQHWSGARCCRGHLQGTQSHISMPSRYGPQTSCRLSRRDHAVLFQNDHVKLNLFHGFHGIMHVIACNCPALMLSMDTRYARM